MVSRHALLGFSLLLMAWPPSSFGESIHTGGRPDAPPASRGRGDGLNSTKVPGLAAFFSTLGVVPPIQISHLTPLADDSPEAIRRWTREMRVWKADTQRLSFLLSTLSRATKGKTRSEAFVNGLEEIQKQLNLAVTKVMKEEKKAGGLTKLPINSIGGRVVSDPARKINEEVLLMLIGFSESFVEVTGENPRLSEQERRRLALRRLKTRMPKDQLLSLSQDQIEGLTTHHQQQIQDLLKLRDSLYAKGNFFPFVEQVYQGYQSRQTILDG